MKLLKNILRSVGAGPSVADPKLLALQETPKPWEQGLTSLNLMDYLRDSTPSDYVRSMRLEFNAKPEWFRAHLDRFGFGGMRRVVETGCGFGRWTIFLAERNTEVVGYDIEPSLINIASTMNNRLFELPNLRYGVAGAGKLPEPDSSFDGAFVHGLTFLVDRPSVFSELSRVTEPGGRLFVGAFNAKGKIIEGLSNNYQRGGFEDEIYKRYRKAALGGPLAQGPYNYAEKGLLDEILAPYKFKVDHNWPVLDFKAHDLDPTEQELVKDLAKLLETFETDQRKRDEIIANANRLKRGVEFDLWFTARKYG